MRVPAMASTVERRLLVNYRVEPEIAATMLPAPLRPQLVRGAAVAGICLIRLGQLRPPWLPARIGWRTENAAHRIAVCWDDAAAGGTRHGVFIPLRHTGSCAVAGLGGRLFPGVHHLARFTVRESSAALRVALAGSDGTCEVDVAVDIIDRWQPGSQLFGGLEEASTFFRTGTVGYSPGHRAGHLDAVEMRPLTWAIEPCAVSHARSSLFDDAQIFPPGTARLDSALVMRQVPVIWHAGPGLAVARAGNTKRISHRRRTP